MDPNADLRVVLEEERASLRSQLTELGISATDLSGDLDIGDSFSDQGHATAERSELLLLAENLLKTLADVDYALERADAGTYGSCDHCGNEIPRARLEARPWSRLCLDCKTRVTA